jgi:cyclase
MLTKRIIPCLDVKEGKVIKGVKFEGHRVAGDIVELAEHYSGRGADELVFYDITASPEGRNVDYAWVRRVAEKINIPFTVAGGIRSVPTMRDVLRAGADKISLNSPALENPDLINQGSREFGAQCIVIGIDSKKVDGEDYVFMYTGSPEKTANTKLKTVDWVKEVIDRGAGEIVLNSMDADGVKNGYSIELLQKVQQVCSVPLIASGGAGAPEHFLEVFRQADVDGALAASVFHFGDIDIQDLKQYLRQEQIEIRL